MGTLVGSELEITELRLGLPGGTKTSRETDSERDQKNERKRVFLETEQQGAGTKGSHKSMAVGWPPVCSYRKRSIGSEKECMEAHGGHGSYSKRLVKISKDGVPILRKIDVGDFKDYFDLAAAVEKLFACSTLGEAMKDAENAEYVPIYEDKDGDWLLIGDVPWKMFVESCKRMRIMRKSDAKGFGVQSK
ncbi:hypothetical protein Cgig2_016603 [Carnegiea gigantea]|uniref:Auxin-responsive protein n=1 Tax=Carnegiea gigantea TaxID=171969 RepID=A0A9Q1QRM7_9CARY|nr:hypothetical protein Cgig2_016603 [Carnegiea gigantea]